LTLFHQTRLSRTVMKKYFLIAVLLYSCCFQSTSQVVSSAVTDSINLYSTMKKVNLLKDSAKVDMLNLIASRAVFILSHQTRIAIEYKYATEALQEATRLNYKVGIARALLTLSETSFYASMNMPGDTALKHGYFLKAFQIAQETNNHELLGWCYYEISGMASYTKNNTDTAIAYSLKSIDNFLKAKDTLFAAQVTSDLGSAYSQMGDYEHAFDYARKSLELSKRSGADFSLSWKQYNVQAALSDIASLYTTAGDYETAMNYILENARYGKENKTGWENFDRDIANLYCTMGKYDSALAYANRIDTFVPPGLFPGRSAVLGQIYLNGTKEYDKAIAEFTRCSDTVRKYLPDTIYATARYLIYIGQAYEGNKNYNTALKYAAQGVRLVEEKNQRPLMMQGYQVLSSIYHHLGNNDSAYEYILRYHTLKDSIQNKQFLLRIYNSKKDAADEKKEARLSLLDKDNKLKTEQLKQELQQKKFLLILFSAFVLTGIFVYRSIYLRRKNEKLRLENELTVQRLENEKKHAELKRQASDLQMQALRAQMNPHFIFNSLSSINWFIMENDKDTASDYLTRFSRLMRMVLNAQKPMIPLEDELKMLQLYLDMERLRLENSFDYSITFTNTIDAGNVSIPPMLLQPFCENAIWHGFKNKEGQGHININIRTEDHLLECMITDDGIGRKQAALFKRKSSKNEGSMGLEITRERLALFSEENNAEADFEMEDLVDEIGQGKGTRVILKIVYKEFIEELA
ncbi:MAG TPA: histidine kinase, partial [Chitinophagaceae bacterium]|nr:histidine kinase [Chitinophagaceae bacterium]